MLNNNFYLFISNSNKQKNLNTYKKWANVDMPASFHFREIKQRIQYSFILLILFSFLAFFEVKTIVEFLKGPISNIKFFQLSPGEYFVETVKISFYTAITIVCPFTLTQFMLFVSPGLTKNEKKLVGPLIFSSMTLFFISLIFSYFCLIPAALNFFIIYSVDIVEPLWSFHQYCDFIILLFFITTILFQIPIFQIILGVLDFISGIQMIKLWKYLILISVVFGAILTPSTDPITQLLLSLAIVILYFLGAIILILIKG